MDSIRCVLYSLTCFLLLSIPGWSSELPNIVYILADDMGYGDVGVYNPESKIPTPNMDRIADEGMRFTDAHTASAVCTPTRYSILTGRYAWRTRLQEGVLWGYSPPLINKDRETIATLAQKAGYTTACVGKWHLGLGWADKGKQKAEEGDVDYSKQISGGPTDIGFDYFFGIPASLDMFPYVYIENNMVSAEPKAIVDKSEGKAFWRAGPVAADFKHDEVLDNITEKSTNFIEKQVKNGTNSPFMLYIPFAAPHTPILPTGKFKGKTGIGDYADFVNQVDWCIGQILDSLKENGLDENTIFIVTSDNGCSPMANFKELREKGHDPSYSLRGHKADIFEGGHRVPFIVRWPDKVKAGAINDSLICQTDLMATIAELTGQSLEADCAEDSFSMLSQLTGTEDSNSRPPVVHHSINGSFAIREGVWKLSLCPGSGGWSAPRPKDALKKKLPPFQLFDLSKDLKESKNIYTDHPEKVRELMDKLNTIVSSGYSRPNSDSINDLKTISMWGPGEKNKPKDKNIVNP